MKEIKKNTYKKEPYKIKKKQKIIHHFNSLNSKNKEDKKVNDNKIEDPLYKNTLKFRFLFFYIPKNIFKDCLSFQLTFYVRLICVFYSLRATITNYNAMKTNPNKIDYNIIINYICIFTSFFLYLSLFNLSRKIATIGYYIYAIHLYIKLYSSIKLFANNLDKYYYTKETLFGTILGLSTASTINFCTTWIIFSYMVFTYNFKNNQKNTK